MLIRFLVHIKNIYSFFIWVFSDYYVFKNFLESKGYYSISFYKIWLWKDDSKYFKVFNQRGESFFLKMKQNKNIIYESYIVKRIEANHSGVSKFSPKIYESNIGQFSYNIYEDLSGLKIKKFSGDRMSILNQMIQILKIFREENIIHRDIRPHNIVIIDGVLKLLDYEHCTLNNKAEIEGINLNQFYRVSKSKWDDAFSFKKIIDKYWSDNEIIKSEAYQKINSMIGDYEYNKK